MRLRGRLRTLLFLLAVLSYASLAHGQTITAVTGTITDSTGLPYSQARIQFVLDGTGGAVPSLTPCSNPVGCQFQIPNPVTADATGTFAVSLPANASILPASTQWHFYVTIPSPPQTLPPLGTGPQSFDLAITISGASQSVSSVLSAASKALSNITGGGGGVPASPSFATQMANNGHTAFSTVAGVNSDFLGCDVIPSCANYTIPFNLILGGPRPRTDVTAYGAKGDGATDDTAAIQAAITAVCAENITTRSTLYFPPGGYLVKQPQTPSTSPVFSIPCSYLLIEGNGGNPTNQFGQAGQSRIGVSGGASPNAAAVFNPNGLDGIIFKNIQISGVNQAVYIQSGNGIAFENVGLSVLNTGQTDNVPLKISQTIQLSWKGGNIQAPDGSHDDVLVIGADTGGTEVQPSGLLWFDGSGGNFWVGEGIHYSQRVNTCCSGPGDIHIWNILVEDSAGSIFRVTNDSGNPGSAAMPSMHAIDIQNFSGSDGSSAPTVNFNSSGSLLTGIEMRGNNENSNANYAIQMQAGTLANCHTTGTVTKVEDGSGNPFGACQQGNSTGIDQGINNSDLDRMTANLADMDGAPIRQYVPGNAFASTALDPSFGLNFSAGLGYGYTANLWQLADLQLDVGFPQTLPPTSVAGTAAAGGSLTSGTTYYYFIRSSTNALCTNMSAPSLISNGTLVSGGNLSVALTWTPAVNGSASSAGYCIFRSTSASTYSAQGQYPNVFVSGQATASYTDTGSGFSCCNVIPPYNTMQSAHRFTLSGLNLTGGVNYYADTGAANAYAITTSPTIAVLPAGAVFNVKAANANTGSSTLNVDSLGAIAIRSYCNARTLVSGDIVANAIFSVQYDGTQFELLGGSCNPPISDPTTTSGDQLVRGASALIRLPVNTSAVPEVNTSVNGATSLSAGGVQWISVTGTSYTVLCADNLGAKMFTNTAAVGVTLFQANSCSSPSVPNFAFEVASQGNGSSQAGVTITPTTSTIAFVGGTQGASITVNFKQVVFIYTDTASSGCTTNGCYWAATLNATSSTPTLDAVLNPVNNASFTFPATEGLTVNGTAPASSSGAGTASGALATFTAPVGGATTGSATTAGQGGTMTLTCGAGGSGAGGTNAIGGAGGDCSLVAGGGGASGGTAANARGGNIILTPGAAGIGGSGAAGSPGAVVVGPSTNSNTNITGVNTIIGGISTVGSLTLQTGLGNSLLSLNGHSGGHLIVCNDTAIAASDYCFTGISLSIGGTPTASLSNFEVSGSLLTGDTGTTNFPFIYGLVTGATAPSTWSTSGTMFGLNSGSGFAGNFADYHLNGGSSLYSVDYQGIATGSILQASTGTQAITGADYTNSTTGQTTVFTWTLPATAAAKTYHYECNMLWESTNTTLVGPVFAVNISAAPTQLTANAQVNTALAGTYTTGYLSNATTGSQTLITSAAAGATTTNYPARIWGTIEGSPTAGATFTITAAATSSTTATLNIRRGSTCSLF